MARQLLRLALSLLLGEHVVKRLAGPSGRPPGVGGICLLRLEAPACSSLLWLHLLTVTKLTLQDFRPPHPLSSKGLEQFPKSILSLAPKF